MQNNEFSSDHLDVLKELMNIAMGNATANIADLLQAFGTMHIPHLQISDVDGLKNYIKMTISSEDEYYVTKQLFGGKIGGEFIFLVNKESAINLGNYLYDTVKVSDADIMDAVIELTNILSSTTIGRLTDELNTKVQFFAPYTEVVSGDPLISEEETLNYHKIIIISTVLEFQKHKISGQIFILSRDEMIISLRELIDQKLEELYS
ncbi:MAG TPA: chemotaxis protein CheC [Sulfuricurvum sp.]|nr:MAG: chemotaxis protein CheC [Campylobacterales bacterium 16-40-21]OZA01743.1 MAG: chemotaxis protein CheC [Sulfuricurvum sp. 17-40-25]HQS67948.1 chemotaxis protein CheC [Sulfuricurvum sp.]HQT37687.1 chemotaxis protein CheC [Sulfuricurvum sp.]